MSARDDGATVESVTDSPVGRAAIAAARLEDYAETLTDVDMSAVKLAPHVDALEEAARLLARVVTAVGS